MAKTPNRNRAISTNFSVNLTGPITRTISIFASRVGDNVTLSWSNGFSTGINASAVIAINFSNMPSWARPLVSAFGPVFVRDGGADQATPGTFSVPTAGNGACGKTALAGTFSANVSSTGFDNGQISYVGSVW